MLTLTELFNKKLYLFLQIIFNAPNIKIFFKVIQYHKKNRSVNILELGTILKCINQPIL